MHFVFNSKNHAKYQHWAESSIFCISHWYYFESHILPFCFSAEESIVNKICLDYFLLEFLIELYNYRESAADAQENVIVEIFAEWLDKPFFRTRHKKNFFDTMMLTALNFQWMHWEVHVFKRLETYIIFSTIYDY